MIVRVRKTDEGFVVPLTPEMARLLDLTDGSQVELQAHYAQPTTAVHATPEMALASFERTLAAHENSYRELAK